MLTILADSDLHVDAVHALASRKSVGREVSFGDQDIKCEDLETFDFTTVDIALMSAGGDVSKKWSPKIAAAGCVVIDNSSAWRMDPDVPLIVPEVNADAVMDFKKGIIANPNCSTIQMVVALKPLHDRAKIKRVVVSTYQSVSGGGKKNRKMKAETMKILDPKVKVSATCVRVPTFVGHAESINVEFENELSADDARDLLRESPGIMVVDKPDNDDPTYVTPVECVGEYATYISRLREDSTQDNTLNFWCVSDNLRKGAALNTVQIAELLANRKLPRNAQSKAA